MVVAGSPVPAAPPVGAPPIPGWLGLPAAPAALEATPPEDPAAPLVAVPPVVSPAFAEPQPTADSATISPRERSSVTDLLFMVPFRHASFLALFAGGKKRHAPRQALNR
jgi:hypothetical protein